MITSALIGAGLGFITKSYFVRWSIRNNLTRTIVTRYLDIRNEISEIVSECAVEARANDEQWRLNMLNTLGKLHYKYFDYIPNEIIRELICLQACLKDKNNYLYKVNGRSLFKMKASEIEGFCYVISSFGNFSHSIYLNLMYGPEMQRKNRRVEYQSRHVLIMINHFFTEKNLSSLTLFQPKKYQ